MAQSPLRFSRREDPKDTALKECIGVMQRLYDLTGQPDIKEIIDRANLALGGVPQRQRADTEVVS